MRIFIFVLILLVGCKDPAPCTTPESDALALVALASASETRPAIASPAAAFDDLAARVAALESRMEALDLQPRKEGDSLTAESTIAEDKASSLGAEGRNGHNPPQGSDSAPRLLGPYSTPPQWPGGMVIPRTECLLDGSCRTLYCRTLYYWQEF